MKLKKKFYPVLPVLLLAIYYLLSNKYFGYFCPSQAFIGFPCPACGMTRAAILFAAGKFQESFVMHPLLIPALVLIGLYLLFKIQFPNMLKSLYYPAILLLISSFVLLMYRVIFQYGYEPIVFNPNSAMGQIFQNLR